MLPRRIIEAIEEAGYPLPVLDVRYLYKDKVKHKEEDDERLCGNGIQQCNKTRANRV